MWGDRDQGIWNQRQPTVRGYRRGISRPIGCEGIGLHSGAAVSMRFVPAETGSGIVFHRADIGVTIPARYDYVVDTQLSTTLGIGEHRIGLVEHVMAALAGLGVDDVRVEVNGPELPILDGSAAEFAFLLSCAGIIESDMPLSTLDVLRPVQVFDGNITAELHPLSAGEPAFPMALTIDFADVAIGRQHLALTMDAEQFSRELAQARTFTLATEIKALRAAGLAQGGSLANAIVVENGNVVNPEGLRWPDEFVRHKMLDVVGDLALACAPIRGRFTGERTGHRMNNRLLRALFADANNYRIVAPAPVLAAVA
jgi:UDP-3-O-[3-hydroxymyristoyl] N-acetylglucosamine deacetylase